MEALATLADLEAVLLREITTDESPRLTRLLEMASGIFRSESRQTISVVAGDVITIRGSWDSQLFVPERPVTAVASVTIRGVLLDPSAYTWRSTGLLERQFASWGDPWAPVIVTYDHGYTEIPDDVVGVICDMVANVVVNPSRVDAETIGSYSHMRRGSTIGLTITEEQTEIAEKYAPPMPDVDVRTDSWPSPIY